MELNVMIDTELLIKAVKRHPPLYNKNVPTYFHKSHHKPKIWHEVCREVFSNWDQLKPQERVGLVYQVQKRWKNLRTCFSREVLMQKLEAKHRKQNVEVKPRKCYGYYKKLSFLLENAEEDEEDNKADDSDDDYDDDRLDNVKTENYEVETEVALDMPETYAEAFEPVRSTYANNSNRQEEKIEHLKGATKSISNLKKDEEDEDKQFLMSLIPTLRKLNDKQKFEARIEILKVLKDISFQSDAGPSC